jgi:hypothetical protein
MLEEVILPMLCFDSDRRRPADHDGATPPLRNAELPGTSAALWVSVESCRGGEYPMTLRTVVEAIVVLM